MRTHKKYTNATFTRRVDHDAGRHRGARAPREPLLCAGCGAIYVKRRWTHEPSARAFDSAHAYQPIEVRVCPACRRRTSGAPHGYVHIDGEFVVRHHEEIERLVANEDARAREDNPLGRILQISPDGTGGLLVTTTTEHLAIRIGRALEKAFDGKLLFGIAHETRLAHVWWHRDLAA
jgi:hypothetical protein